MTFDFDLAPDVHITFGIGTEQDFRPPDEESRCPNCGSTAEPTWVEAYGPTGVRHPDGGPAEYSHQAGWKCPACGAIEEESA